MNKLLSEIEEALVKTKETQEFLCTLRDMQENNLIQNKIDGLSDITMALYHAHDKIRKGD